MKILRLVLRNFKGIYDGLGRTEIEINFPNVVNDQNKITMLIGKNGTGKSVILSHMSPFFETNDIRDNFDGSIIENADEAYKEIVILDSTDVYLIKHYWKKGKVRSYLEKNGVELNSSAGVRTFKSLVEEHLGLSVEFFKVGRIGSNVSNFIDLNSSDRKRYISNFVPDVDPYLTINKTVSTILSNDRRLIAYLSDELGKLKSLEEIKKEISSRELLLSGFNLQLEKVRTDKANNLAHKSQVDQKLKDSGFDPSIIATLDDINLAIDKTKNLILDMQTNYPKLSEETDLKSRIDETRERITGLEKDLGIAAANKNSVSGNITTLKSDITNKSKDLVSINQSFKQVAALEQKVEETRLEYANMQQVLTTLSSKYEEKFAQYSHSDIISIDQFLKSLGDRLSSALGSVNKSTLTYLEELSENKTDLIQYIFSMKEQVTKQIDSALRDKHIKDVSLNTVRSNAENTDVLKLRPSLCRIDSCGFISNALRYQKDLEKIPTLELDLQKINERHSQLLQQLDMLNEAYNILSLLNNISERISNNLKLRLFAIYNFKDITSLIKIMSNSDFRLFKVQDDLIQYSFSKTNLETLKSNLDALESKLTAILDKKTYAENVTNELTNLNERLSSLEEELFNINNSIAELNTNLTKRKKALSIYSSYKELVESLDKYEKEFVETSKLIESSKNDLRLQNSIKMELASLETEINSLIQKIEIITKEINDYRIKETRYSEYVAQKEALEDTFERLSLVKEATDVTKGIPVKLIDRYLKSISDEANKLLDIAYRGNFNISFNVTDKELAIPVSKVNGSISPDIAVTSQGQQAMTKTTLSLAIFKRVFNKYNILSLDEIDAELDSENRKAFLDILNVQINDLALEQVFVISHNNEFLTQKHINLILLPGHTAPLNEARFMDSKRIIADFS